MKLFTTLFLASALATQAGETFDAKATFDRLKSLAGEWQADTSMGKSAVTYELIANGSAIMERDRSEHMGVMVTLYNLDGDRLILTHYCMVGNQPRMQARSFDAKTGELRFQFLDATNLTGPEAGHMHNATLRFIDDQHFNATWDFFQGGQKKQSEKFEFTRVR